MGAAEAEKLRHEYTLLTQKVAQQAAQLTALHQRSKASGKYVYAATAHRRTYLTTTVDANRGKAPISASAGWYKCRFNGPAMREDAERHGHSGRDISTAPFTVGVDTLSHAGLFPRSACKGVKIDALDATKRAQLATTGIGAGALHAVGIATVHLLLGTAPITARVIVHDDESVPPLLSVRHLTTRRRTVTFATPRDKIVMKISGYPTVNSVSEPSTSSYLARAGDIRTFDSAFGDVPRADTHPVLFDSKKRPTPADTDDDIVVVLSSRQSLVISGANLYADVAFHGRSVRDNQRFGVRRRYYRRARVGDVN